MRVGGLPVWVRIRPFYHGKPHRRGAACLLWAAGPGVFTIFAVTSLCFAKEHRADKARGTDLCRPDCGKGAGTGTRAGKTRRWLENRDVCTGPICVFRGSLTPHMFGLQLLISTIFSTWSHLCQAFSVDLTHVTLFFWSGTHECLLHFINFMFCDKWPSACISKPV